MSESIEALKKALTAAETDMARLTGSLTRAERYAADARAGNRLALERAEKAEARAEELLRNAADSLERAHRAEDALERADAEARVLRDRAQSAEKSKADAMDALKRADDWWKGANLRAANAEQWAAELREDSEKWKKAATEERAAHKLTADRAVQAEAKLQAEEKLRGKISPNSDYLDDLKAAGRRIIELVADRDRYAQMWREAVERASKHEADAHNARNELKAAREEAGTEHARRRVAEEEAKDAQAARDALSFDFAQHRHQTQRDLSAAWKAADDWRDHARRKEEEAGALAGKLDAAEREVERLKAAAYSVDQGVAYWAAEFGKEKVARVELEERLKRQAPLIRAALDWAAAPGGSDEEDAADDRVGAAIADFCRAIGVPVKWVPGHDHGAQKALLAAALKYAAAGLDGESMASIALQDAAMDYAKAVGAPVAGEVRNG